MKLGSNARLESFEGAPGVSLDATAAAAAAANGQGGPPNQNATQSIYLKRQEGGKKVARRAAKERHEKEQSEFRGRSERSGSKARLKAPTTA